MKLIIPEGYKSLLDLKQTEMAIKEVKDFFESSLSSDLKLRRVTAPLFVMKGTGINDDLNGIERPVSFPILDLGNATAEVVQSLAKWKRMMLCDYEIRMNHGIYTDMNALRPDEELDNLHSVYVDQWDWEKRIEKADRKDEYLEATVKTIYAAIKALGDFVNANYHNLKTQLPDEIFFITSQELEDKYPNLTAKERENEITREKRAVFIKNIGGALKSGQKHDGRAPDYDDWNLNGDIILWNDILDLAFEISSMGIRVDEVSMLKQLEIAGALDRQNLEFHSGIINKTLPYSVGGGIGQSRLCMYFLRKAHIGEVQVSVWPIDMINSCKENNIILL